MNPPRHDPPDRTGFVLPLLLAVAAIGLVLVPVATLLLASLANPDPGAAATRGELTRLSRDLAGARADWERTVDPEQRVEIDRRIRLLAERVRRIERAPSPPREVWTLAAFTRLGARDLLDIARLLGQALLVAAGAALLCHPLAHAAAIAPDRRRAARAILAVVAPAVVIDLVGVHAWTAAMAALDPVGLGAPGAESLAARSVTLLGLVAAALPVMLLPLWAALARLDRTRIEAARDLGASRWLVHARIVLPVARPGLALGAILTFVLAAGALGLPEIVARGRGRGDAAVIPPVDWSLAAAWGTVLLAATLLVAAVAALAAWFTRPRPGDFTDRRD